jgi:hypothetical protein
MIEREDRDGQAFNFYDYGCWSCFLIIDPTYGSDDVDLLGRDTNLIKGTERVKPFS